MVVVIILAANITIQLVYECVVLLRLSNNKSAPQNTYIHLYAITFLSLLNLRHGVHDRNRKFNFCFVYYIILYSDTISRPTGKCMHHNYFKQVPHNINVRQSVNKSIIPCITVNIFFFLPEQLT